MNADLKLWELKRRFDQIGAALLESADSKLMGECLDVARQIDELLCDIGWWGDGWLVYPWEHYGPHWADHLISD